MKSLENKLTEMAMTSKEDSPKVSYSDLIKIVCNAPIQGGYSLTDIRSRIAIISACENVSVGAELLFENADVVYLQSAVKNQRWTAIHKDIITFTDDVEKMKDKK